jgi:hypothetical protein
VVTIGNTESSAGETAEVFDRITDVQVLGDGRIAVANSGGYRVSIFDSEGGFELSLGGEGDGPGEFRLLSRIRECGRDRDGYHVMDDSKMRIKVFNVDGSFRDEHRVWGYNPNQPPWRWDCADDHVLTMQWGDGDPRVGEVGRFRIPVPIALSGPDGRMTKALGWILGPERYRFENRGTGPAPLGVVTGLAIRHGTVYVAEGPLIRVDAFSFGGDHLWTMKATSERRPVDRTTFIESQRSPTMTDEEERAFNARWRDWDFPEHLPAFRGFLVDDGGRMWIEEFPAPGDVSITWLVVDPNGTWRAAVRVPRNVELKDVEQGKAAGVMRDTLEVESAVVFAIRGDRATRDR